MAPEQSGVIAGRNPVREALERAERPIEKVLIAKGAHGEPVDAIRRAARAAGVPVQGVPPKTLDRVAKGLVHQGVVALAAALDYADVGEALHAIAATPDEVKRKKPLVVVLDSIEDPHNLGAILRSAVAAGAALAIVPERRSAPLSATAVKASAGTADRIPVARVPNLADTVLGLKERGYWVFGLDGAAEQAVWEQDWDRPVALVVGSEGGGLRPRVRDACDGLVAIPMPGPAESLNASVAAGIALFSVVRGRAAKG